MYSNYGSRAGGPRVSAGNRNSQMQKLEALFGGSSAAAPQRTSVTTAGGRAALEEKLAAAFKAAKQEEDQKPSSISPAVEAENIKAPSAYRIRLERIKNAADEAELNSAISTFLASHELPDDIDIILKVLKHPEEKIVLKGLSELVGMVERKQVSGTSLVFEALDNLEKRNPGREICSYISGLRAMLG